MYLKKGCLFIIALALLVFVGQASAGPNANATISIDLIPNGGAGNQIDDGVTSGTVSGQGTKIAVEIFAKGVATPLIILDIEFDFDTTLLRLVQASPGITSHDRAAILPLAPFTLPESSFLMRVEFATVVDVTNREFTLGIKAVTLTQTASLSDEITTESVIWFNMPTSNKGDFDGNSVVNIEDFLIFIRGFGKSVGDVGFDARMDFDGNGIISIPDFLQFIQVFGKTYPIRHADLIVESPVVSKISLMPDESFTLQATVRNRGDGSAAATILQYYRSTDATITNSDTKVGSSNSVGSLAASDTSGGTTSLTAPSSEGTYYYGACVDPVSGESNTNNNCSTGVQVTVSGGVVSQREALVALYNATDGPNWTNNSNWLSGNDISTWYGVSVSNGWVTRLDLLNNNLTGSISGELDNLSNLTVLWLDGNQLSGAIPIQLSNLSNLTALHLNNNQLRGEIPTELGNLTNLIQLGLGGNQLSGVIPTQLSNLSNLMQLWLGHNQLSGQIPVALTGLTNLTHLTLNHNQLSGSMPTQLGNLTNLEWLYLHNNTSLTDALPQSLTKLAKLEAFYFQDTGLCAPLGAPFQTWFQGIKLTSGSNCSTVDLMVESRVNKNSLKLGESFTLQATIRNRGDGSAAATILQYYRSTDATITNSDTKVGNHVVGSLAASRASEESISLTAPSSAGTYYYGACVDPVSGESNTNNNCSTGVQVTISVGDIVPPIRNLTSDNINGDLFPAWSGDNRIAYDSWRNGGWYMYVMNADGTNKLREAAAKSKSYERYPTWSPDSKSITFHSKSGDYYEIYVRDVDKDEENRLTFKNNDDRSPSWSPDSTYIAFHSNRDGNYEIYRMDADGANPSRLTTNSFDDRSPSWSPDSKSITFHSNRDGNYEIYRMDADGSNQHRLTTNNAEDEHPTWSPDSKFIAFSSERSDGNYEIYVQPIDGEDVHRLTYNNAEDAHPTWSPDGKFIAFHSYRRGSKRADIFVRSATKYLSRLTASRYNDMYPPSWSPNGGIAFTTNRDGNVDIYVMDENGSTPRNLTNNSADDARPSWSPDGEFIAFHSNRDDGNYNIYKMNVNDGKPPIQLTYTDKKDADPAWSPNSKYIAFRTDRHGQSDIYRMDADGSNQHRLTTNSAYDGNPSWSRDSGYIVFQSRRYGNYDIYVMDADGSNQRRLTTNSAGDERPSWSRDGRYIAFQSHRNGNWEIYVMRAPGNEKANTPPVRITYNNDIDEYPAWSPGSRSIIFISHRDAKSETEEIRSSNIYKVDVLE